MASTLSSSEVNEDALQRVHEDAEKKPNLPVASHPTPLIWFLVCVGLYLGALLYGEKPSTLLLPSTLIYREARPRHHYSRGRTRLGLQGSRRDTEAALDRHRFSNGLCGCHPAYWENLWHF